MRTLALFLLAGTSAMAEVVWRGDFDTGDLGQWSRVEAVHANRLQVIQSPHRQGQFALRAAVLQGDKPIDASGNRNELVHRSPSPEGAERWFRWSTRAAENFPDVDDWQVFTQWHHTGCCGSPPLLFNIRGEELMFLVTEGGGEPVALWRAPLERGKWNDFVLHVKWSASPSVGFVELFYDGALVLPLTHVATLRPGEENYLKLGLYRSSDISAEGVVFHDGFIEATERADVFSAAEAPADDSREASPLASGQGGCAAGGQSGFLAVFLAALAAARIWTPRRRRVAWTRCAPTARSFSSRSS